MSVAPYDQIAEWYDRYLADNLIYRGVLLPALLEIIGDVGGQEICDLACGQGWFARELAQRGAQVTGIDLSDQLLTLARRYEEASPLGIIYRQDDVQNPVSLVAKSFDGCVCILALMDIPDFQAVFGTIARILKPGGWLTFAITHPCFELPSARWIPLDDGQVVRGVRGYFKEGFWRSEGGGVRSRVGAYHRMLNTYLNALVASNLVFERMLEPRASGEWAAQVPGSQEVPGLLLIRARALPGGV